MLMERYEFHENRQKDHTFIGINEIRFTVVL